MATTTGPGSKVVTTFGLRDVAVAALVTTAGGSPVWKDLPSVESAAFKGTVGEVKQYGDDRYQGTFYHTQEGSVSVKFNKLSMAIMSLISGNDAVIDSTTQSETMYFGTNKELIPPLVSVKAIVPYRDETTGQAREMEVIWFRCDVKTPWDSFPGGERAKIGENTLVFNTYSSQKDETATAISLTGVDYAFGKFTLK